MPSVPFSLVFHNHSGIAWLWTSSHSSSLLICLISFDPRSLQTLVYWIQIRLWNNVTWKGNGKGNNCSKHLWNRKLFLALLCLMLVSSEYVLFKISFFQVSRRYKQIAFDFDTYLVILKLPSSILTQATTPGLYPVLYNRFRTNMYKGGIVTLGGYFRGRPLLASWLQSSLFTISSFKTYKYFTFRFKEHYTKC